MLVLMSDTSQCSVSIRRRLITAGHRTETSMNTLQSRICAVIVITLAIEVLSQQLCCLAIFSHLQDEIKIVFLGHVQIYFQLSKEGQ